MVGQAIVALRRMAQKNIFRIGLATLSVAALLLVTSPSALARPSLQLVPASQPDTCIDEMYLFLLQRPADAAGLAFFTGFINGGGSRTDAATMLIESAEYRALLVESLYQRLLNRPADPAGLSFFQSLLASGATPEEVMAAILSSDEYFGLAGGSNAGFVTQLYQDLLGRSPSAGELALLQSMLDSGASRAEVVKSILGSAEYFTRLVQTYYAEALDRGPSDAELDLWLNALSGGASSLEVLAGIVGSPEFCQVRLSDTDTTRQAGDNESDDNVAPPPPPKPERERDRHGGKGGGGCPPVECPPPA